MTQMIFLNLPVVDLRASKEFYSALGWKLNEEYSDENAACFIVEENICVMLLTHEWFSSFTDKPIADTHTSVAAAYAMAQPSRDAVDELVERALRAGGRDDVNPSKEAQEAQESVGMYGRSFYDLDGHLWEVFHMQVGNAEA